MKEQEHEDAAPLRSGARTSLVILIIFFLSGACGLIYEVIWQKMLCLVFGITTYATTTILAAFMVGLALGSLCFGRAVDRRTRPLRLYAQLELGVGLFGLFFHVILVLIGACFTSIARHYALSFAALTAVRFALCFAVLALPAFLMGGTLPVMSRYFVRSTGTLGRGLGSLYGSNTIGAALGCILAGFVLAVQFGAQSTLYIAAVTNLLLGGIAFYLDKTQPDAIANPPPAQEMAARVSPREKPRPQRGSSASESAVVCSENVIRLMTVAAGISGFCALAYEVIWSRTLIIFQQASVYAFPTMLSTFLCGSALGSLTFARFVDHQKRSLLLLGAIQLSIGVTALLTLLQFTKLGEMMISIWDHYGTGWYVFAGSGFLASFAIMFVPTLLMGISFPLIACVCARRLEFLGSSLGFVYSVNTLGSVLGAMAAGFLLIPFLGVTKAMTVVSLINIALGLWLVLAGRPAKSDPGYVIYAAAVLVIGIAVIRTVPWENPLGTYSHNFTKLKQGEKLDYYQEGVGATVSVTRGEPQQFDSHIYRSIAVDGVAGAGDKPLLRTIQKLQGHFPLLFYKACTGKDAQYAFILGLGTGEASCCIAKYPVVRVDCAELASAEVGANHLFSTINEDLLHNPKFNLILNDARNHLLTSKTRYDIIQSDSVHPDIAFNTYTREYFQLCRERLSDDGIFSTWIPLYNFTKEDLCVLVKTLHSVFPHVYICYSPNYSNKHAILIGMNLPLRLDYPLLKAELNRPVIQQSLEAGGLDRIAGVLDTLVADENAMAPFLENLPVNTDDNLFLPYHIPKNQQVGEDTMAENLRFLNDLHVDMLRYLVNFPLPEQQSAGYTAHHEARPHVLRAVASYYDQNFENALQEFGQALAICPDDPAIQYLSTEMKFLQAYDRGQAARRKHNYPLAAQWYQQALNIKPDNVWAIYYLSTDDAARGDSQAALDKLRRALAIAPDFIDAKFTVAAIIAGTDRKQAIGLLREVLDYNPQMQNARELLGKLENEPR